MSEAPIKNIAHETVTVAATAAAVSSRGVRAACIEADDANVGAIFLGGSGVTTTNYGRKLNPGDVIDLGDADLSALFAIAANANDKLHLLEVL